MCVTGYRALRKGLSAQSCHGSHARPPGPGRALNKPDRATLCLGSPTVSVSTGASCSVVAVCPGVFVNQQTNGEFSRVHLEHNVGRGLGTLFVIPGSSNGYGKRQIFCTGPLAIPALVVEPPCWRVTRWRFGWIWLVCITLVLSCSSFKRADYRRHSRHIALMLSMLAATISSFIVALAYCGVSAARSLAVSITTSRFGCPLGRTRIQKLRRVIRYALGAPYVIFFERNLMLAFHEPTGRFHSEWEMSIPGRMPALITWSCPRPRW